MKFNNKKGSGSMLKLGKAEKIIEVEIEELQENELSNVNTLVVGSPGTAKDLTVTVPNILFEENKNIFVFDANNELANPYAYKGLDEYKEKQGYKIWRYDLMEEGLLDKINHILTTQDSEKHFVHIHFKQEVFTVYDRRYRELTEHQNKIKELVYQVMCQIRLSNDDRAKRGFHLFLMNADSYHSNNIAECFATFRGYNIGITMSVSSVKNVDETLLENTFYIVLKAQKDKEEANCITEKLKYHHLNCIGTKFTPSEYGSLLISTPLTASMLQDLPNDMALVCKRIICRKDRTHKEAGWNRLVETYNAMEILLCK